MIEGSQTETLESSEGAVAPLPPAPPVKVGVASGLRFRVDERYEVDGDAEVVVRSDSWGMTLLRGSILDISATGCYIQTLAPVRIKPDTEVHIIFSVYGMTFRVAAISRFAKSKVGIGFRFIEIDEITRDRLHAVLADIRSKLIEADPDAPLPVIERTLIEE